MREKTACSPGRCPCKHDWPKLRIDALKLSDDPPRFATEFLSVRFAWRFFYAPCRLCKCTRRSMRQMWRVAA